MNYDCQEKLDDDDAHLSLLTLSAVALALFPVDTPRAGVWYTRVIRGKRRVFISVFGQQDLSQLAILRQEVVSG